MRIFLLTTICVLFAFCCSTFAVNINSKIEREKQLEQQKMVQLKQLLMRTSESGGMGKMVNGSPPGATDPFGAPQSPLPAADNSTVDDPSSSPSPSPGVQADAQADTQPNLYDQAFSGVVGQLLPMTTDQIAKLREVFTESQRAAATPAGIPPRPVTTSLLINLSPQAVSPVIRLGAGYITSLVFVDSTGQPWPIAAYSVGDPSAFNIQWDRKGNTLLIQSMTFYKRSNLAVILRDLNTPIMITLISGQEAIDYRVDLRVPGIGPNAVYVQNGVPDAVNPVLFDVLNGTPPKGSKELKVSSSECQAWLLNNKLYLRTSLNITSPGWQAIMSSIDGTHAYQLQPSPVILALKNGKDKIITLILEGLE